jgi:hypothetical protein
VLKTMLQSKIKIETAFALVVLACAGGSLAFPPGLAAREEPAKQAEAAEAKKGAQAASPALTAWFPDLTKIDRTIVKEPKYKTQPYYALLAIGPEAKKRVWLVVDGETLYVDRNGNGDLTEANKRVEQPKKIEVAPGMYKHMNSFDLGEVQGLRLRVDFWVRNKDFVPDNEFEKKILKDHQENGWEFATLYRVKADGSNLSAQIPVAFCRNAKDTQICHLGGRLTFALRANDLLERHSDKNILQMRIGTPGLPARKWSDPVFAPLGTNEVPADLHPVAHFEFPHKDAKQPPIKLEAVLNQRC